MAVVEIRHYWTSQSEDKKLRHPRIFQQVCQRRSKSLFTNRSGQKGLRQVFIENFSSSINQKMSQNDEQLSPQICLAFAVYGTYQQDIRIRKKGIFGILVSSTPSTMFSEENRQCLQATDTVMRETQSINSQVRSDVNKLKMALDDFLNAITNMECYAISLNMDMGRAGVRALASLAMQWNIITRSLHGKWVPHFGYAYENVLKIETPMELANILHQVIEFKLLKNAARLSRSQYQSCKARLNFLYYSIKVQEETKTLRNRNERVLTRNI